MKQGVTKKAVDELIGAAMEKGRTLYLYDGKLAGFGAYATKAGKASYFVQYRTGGRETPSKRLTVISGSTIASGTAAFRASRPNRPLTRWRAV